MRRHLLIWACAVMFAGAPTALGAHEDGRDRHDEDGKDFIGVFYPVPVVVRQFDANACPASHPYYFEFRGVAMTNVGRGTFVQHHCEDAQDTSFVRGRQTITFDGGVLEGTYSGTILVNNAPSGYLIVDGSYRNQGGTGRFAHAHGRGISAGLIDLVKQQFTVTVSGAL